MSSAEQVERAASRGQRKAIIRVRLEELMRRVPATWAQWDTEQTQQFNRDCRRLRSMGAASPMKLMLEVAQRIGNAYGVGMVTIDPNHGEAP